jgi:hypothetical protein
MRCFIVPPTPYTTAAWLELYGTPATIVERSKNAPELSSTHRMVAFFDTKTRTPFAAVVYDESEMRLFQMPIWGADGDQIRWFVVAIEHLRRVSTIEEFERRIADWRPR